MKRAPFMLIIAFALTGACAAVAADAAFASSAGWTAHRAASAPLLSVAAADAAHAWAVGPGPTIVTTSDGGASWTAQSPATAGDLYGVAFSDATDGWAVGPDGTVVATTDGGADWAPQTSPTTKTLIGVACRGQDCWAVGGDAAGGVIIATTDGGTTWLPQRTTVRDLFSVSFTDANHGWAVGDHGKILATTDGGATWTAQKSPSTGYLNGVSAVGALHAWAVGEKGLILATSDGGTHWVVRRAAAKKATDLYTVAFADKRHGWAVGVGGVILATTNGGATWRVQHCPKKQDLASVAFADTLHGFVAGTVGTMFTTSHAGWSDTRPPVAVAAGTAGWHRRAVRVVLSATDEPSGSGVASLQYSLDLGKTWTKGASFTVAAPADHGNDGVHSVPLPGDRQCRQRRGGAHRPGEDRHAAACGERSLGVPGGQWSARGLALRRRRSASGQHHGHGHDRDKNGRGPAGEDPQVHRAAGGQGARLEVPLHPARRPLCVLRFGNRRGRQPRCHGGEQPPRRARSAHRVRRPTPGIVRQAGAVPR